MTTTFGTSVNAELLKPGVVNAEFVRIDVPGTEDQGGPTFFFSSSYRNESVSGETAKAWTALGGLVGVSGHQRDLSVTSYDTTVSLAGVDQTKIGQILDAGLKGNKVQIYRGFYDTNLNLIDGLKLRYTGIITSYSINEERVEGFDAFTLSINCSSYKIVLENRIAGRLTNAESWRYWNENDPSMDGVAGLNNAKYNFGQKLG